MTDELPQPENSGDPVGEPVPVENPAPLPEGVVAFPEPPERVPFWGFSDLLLVMALAVPCMFAGWGVVKGLMTLFHLHAPAPAAEAVPEMVIGYILLFSMVKLLFMVQYGRPFWKSLGWTSARIPFLWNVILGLFTGLAVGFVGYLLRGPPSSGPIVEMMKGPTALVLVAIYGTTAAPLFEELAFRGFMQPLMVRVMGAAPGIIVTAVLFGSLHYSEYGSSWRSALQISLSGVAFGCIRHWTGSTRASTIMHAAFNTLSFVSLFAQRGAAG